MPNVTPATRNTCVYTPVSAILRHAGLKPNLSRPKGAKGRVITTLFNTNDANAIITAAESFDREYSVLLSFLLYTGVRLGEALRLTWDDVRMKNGAPSSGAQRTATPARSSYATI